jgi:transglutaminase-like putative cysteine protease
MAALAVALAPHIPYLPAWVTLAFVCCTVARFVIEKRRGALPSTWVRGGIAIICFLGVYWTYETISGVGPGSALLATMASLKLLETRRRRDQFVLLFIAIFLVMSSLLREQYLWSVPYMLGALLFIMGAWIRMSAKPSQPLKRSFQASARLLAYAAPLAITMWILFPRISTPFWAVPIDTSSGISGLSDTMSPGDVSSLSLSNEVAFRVRFEGAVPPPRDRYWRALVLHRFNGRSWTGSEAAIGIPPEQQLSVAGEPYRYNVTMEATRQQWVPALDLPFSWDLSQTFMDRMQQLSRVHPVDQRITYNVESYPRYRSEPFMSQRMRRWYLALPGGRNPDTVELARQLRGKTGSDQAFITAVLNRFRQEEFYYTLNPPALGRDPVDAFLFDTRRGFCEHYASAFAVMTRAAGIPTRIVLGYQGGELNPRGDYMIIRQSDAHAWNEVWLEGEGWRRVDPTAAVAPERIELGVVDSIFDGIGESWGLSAPAQWLHDLTLRWDALNASWNDWVLGYGPDKQASFLERLGMQSPTWRKMMLTMIAIVVSMTVVLSLVLMWRLRPPPRDRASVLYGRFLKRLGVKPAIGETPDAFATRLAEQADVGEELIARVVRAYVAVRYAAGGDAAMDELEAAVSEAR